MEPTTGTLIGALPDYKDEWVIIHPNQQVHDIINEVLDAHQDFAPYYDKIALYFDASNVDDIADMLYRFCKKHFLYREEAESEQSTRSPQGMLHFADTRNFDCKHYAGFCGGVLDGLNRLAGRNIDWCYRFASYHMLSLVPHHVFIVINDDNDELWIDPTPNSNVMQPVWRTDKKISGMALIRNIAGFNEGVKAIGISSLAVHPKTDAMSQLNFSATGREPALLNGMWSHYLGLDNYRDYGGDRSIDEWNLAAQLNALIAQAGGVHTVDGNFVKWVYDNSIRSWNFYFPGGVEPNFNGDYWIALYRTGMNEPGWPNWIITQDGRLTISHDVALDDYRNAGIHILTAWAQSLINQYDANKYPLRPAAVKEFSQNYTGNPNNPAASLFTEARGTSVLQDIGSGIEAGVNFLKDAVIEVVGFIPRNAFLGLVAINAFGMASDLANSIANGHWDEISTIWKNLGGNADKLRNTIEHGATAQEVTDMNATVDPTTVTGTIGVVQVAALVAAAAPIIAALLKFLNKDGKLNGAILATEAALQAKYPDANFSFLNGALTQGGVPVTFQGQPQYDESGRLLTQTAPGDFFYRLTLNPPVFGALAAGLTFLVTGRTRLRAQKNKRIVVTGGVGVAAYLWSRRRKQLVDAQILQTQQQSTLQASNTSTGQQLLQSLETGLAAYLQQAQTQPIDTTTQPTDTTVDFNLYADPTLNNYATV